MDCQAYQVRFHNGEHYVSLHYNDQELTLEVEEAKTGYKWGGRYSPQYIEEITRKTGSFKKYPTFLKMLQTALEGGTDSVSADLLSQQDLEVLKKTRVQTASQSTQGKRYLIVTYAVEFDCVRYPLPLIYDEPTSENLQQILDRLAQELSSMKSGQDMELLEMSKDNEALNAQLSKLKHHQTVAAPRKPQPEIDSLQAAKKALEDERRQLEASKTTNLAELKTRSAELEGELNYLGKELDSVLTEAERRAEKKQKAGKYKQQLGSLQGESSKTQGSVNSLNKELKAVKDRLFKLKEAEGRQKQKVALLETELETAIKEAAAKRSTGSSRNASPASRAQPSHTRQRTAPAAARTEGGGQKPSPVRVEGGGLKSSQVRTAPPQAPAQRQIKTSPGQADTRPTRPSPNRVVTRPARVSPVRKQSPGTGRRGGNIDDRLSRLQDLLKSLKS
jgi:coiled-coil domain-containing protein 61